MEIDREDSDFHQNDREKIWSSWTIERNPFDCKFSESILYNGSPIRCFYVAHWIGEPDLIHSRWQANTNPLTPRIIASVRFAGLPLVAPIQATPSLRATPQEGKNKTSSLRWGFILRYYLVRSRISIRGESCTRRGSCSMMNEVVGLFVAVIPSAPFAGILV